MPSETAETKDAFASAIDSWQGMMTDCMVTIPGKTDVFSFVSFAFNGKSVRRYFRSTASMCVSFVDNGKEMILLYFSDRGLQLMQG
jgi:hypothetical protein